MRFLKPFELFESYLKGNKQPLYHYTHNLNKIIETDTLKQTRTAYPRKGKAICLTRFSGYTGASGCDRIFLDTDLLEKNGFIPKPVDEVGIATLDYINGTAGQRKPISTLLPEDEINILKILKSKTPVKKHTEKEREENIKKYKQYSKPFPQDMKISHGITHTKLGLEQEFEERIYKDIPNIGKYILYIDVNYLNYEKELTNYIIKYPHIIVRKLKYQKSKTNMQDSPFLTPTEILLDINKINTKL